MIRPCLKPLPGQTSVLWVMMVLKLLCSLLRNFFSTKSATQDLFSLWGRSLGCRYYFFTNSLEALKFFFQLLNKWLLEWYDVYTGNLLDGAIQKFCEDHFFFFRAKGGRHEHCPNNYCIVSRGLMLVNAIWNELIREKALRSIHFFFFSGKILSGKYFSRKEWLNQIKQNRKKSLCQTKDG